MNWKMITEILYYTLTYGIFFYSAFLLLSYIFLGLFSIGETKKYLHKNRFTDYRLLAASVHSPTVSIIAPAFNEGKTIVENVRSLLAIFYTNLEVIIVNDGSKDDCLEKLIKAYDLIKIDLFVDEKIQTKEIKGIYKSRKNIYQKLIVVDKVNGGKADALNVGINISSKNYLVCIDVDCILEQDAILKMVKPFMEQTNKRVIATGGVIRVANSCEIEEGRLIRVILAEDFLPRMQILEYIRAFILGRMAWSRMNGLMLISGAFGAFDKEIAIACGGYNHNTVGEDMELVVRMRRYMEEKKEDYMVTYIPDPLCWTEVPSTHTILGRQRNRWIRGTYETLKFHRIMFFNPKYRMLGMLSYPYWFLFEMCAPLIEFFGFIVFIVFALTGYIDWIFFFSFFLFIIFFGYLYSAFAILMEVFSFNQYKRRIDIFRLLLTGLAEPFYFHPFVVWSGIQGYVDLMKKKKGWGEMTRQGFHKKKVKELPVQIAENKLVVIPSITNSANPIIKTIEEEEPIWFFEKSVLPILNRLYQSITQITIQYIPLALILGGLLIFTRLFELIANIFAHGIPSLIGKVILTGYAKDFFYWLQVVMYLFPLYLLCSLIHKSFARNIFMLLSILLLLTQLALSQYYISTLVLLGADIWGYSVTELKQTVGASGGVPKSLLMILLVTIVITILVFLYLPKKIKPKGWFQFIFVLITMLSFNNTISSFIQNLKPGQEFSNNLSINKSAYFLQATLQHFLPTNETIDIYAVNYLNIDQIENAHEKIIEHKYIDEKAFPFLHPFDSSVDVLSPFFSISPQKPNIVLILVEGLGRAFTNSGAYLGNFTPSIDSIASKSLYWENFLSEGGRTFAVLPSLISSLPFAKNGFTELGNQMPKHFSLVNLLESNGYRSSFYYGGDAHFDDMDLFLKNNNVHTIYDEKSFPISFSKMPSLNGFSWGYGDQAVFQHFLATNKVVQEPSLSIVLTVSTHNPFLINDQPKYLQRFESRMDELKFSETKKKQYRNYANQYASILYTDETIGNFIREFQSRPDFNNTVFLITGDHRMPEIPMTSKLDRYHVPLIIYSSMLKRTAKFSSISTHFDITPSLLAWLKNSYHLKLPETVSWIGTGLDTIRSFRNIHAYPLMQTKTDLIDFIQGKYLLNANTLFKINERMELMEEENSVKTSELISSFNKFKSKNERFNQSLKLYPDSLLKRYIKE